MLDRVFPSVLGPKTAEKYRPLPRVVRTLLVNRMRLGHIDTMLVVGEVIACVGFAALIVDAIVAHVRLIRGRRRSQEVLHRALRRVLVATLPID